MQTRIGTLRDWTWRNARDWHAISEQYPTLAAEIERLLAAYADAPDGPRMA